MGYPLNLCSNLEPIPNTLQSRVVLYGISLLMDPSPSPCSGGCVHLRCTLSPLWSLRADLSSFHAAWNQSWLGERGAN